MRLEHETTAGSLDNTKSRIEAKIPSTLIKIITRRGQVNEVRVDLVIKVGQLGVIKIVKTRRR